MVINARTDPFLMGLGADDEERLAMSIERGRAYLKAGADLVFIRCSSIPRGCRRAQSTAIGGPISLMALPGAPSAETWFQAGAARVSLGPLAMMAALGVIRDIAAIPRHWRVDVDRTHVLRPRRNEGTLHRG